MEKVEPARENVHHTVGKIAFSPSAMREENQALRDSLERTLVLLGRVEPGFYAELKEENERLHRVIEAKNAEMAGFLSEVGRQAGEIAHLDRSHRSAVQLAESRYQQITELTKELERKCVMIELGRDIEKKALEQEEEIKRLCAERYALEQSHALEQSRSELFNTKNKRIAELVGTLDDISNRIVAALDQ